MVSSSGSAARVAAGALSFGVAQAGLDEKIERFGLAAAGAAASVEADIFDYVVQSIPTCISNDQSNRSPIVQVIENVGSE